MDGNEFKLFQEALISAFPTLAALKRVVKFQFNENLESFAGGSDLADAVYKLIERFDSRGKSEDLISGALAENADNPLLKAFAQKLFAISVLPSSRSQYTTNSPQLIRYLDNMERELTNYINLLSPISLISESTPSAVEQEFNFNFGFSPVTPGVRSGNLPNPMVVQFDSFDEAFEYYEGRLLVLGEPGAGKSMTLHLATLAAVRKRKQAPSSPIPVFVLLHRFSDIKFDELEPGELPLRFKAEYPANLFGNNPMLYILDGLDEIGGSNALNSEQIAVQSLDPRRVFLIALPQQFPEEQVIVSCRTIEYEQAGKKAQLPGAVRILPLSDLQIKEWLIEKREHPAIWNMLSLDDELREMAQTPLLLTMLDDAIGPEEVDAAELHGKDIFGFYIRKRFEHEQSKGTALFTLPETQNRLGKLANYMWQDGNKPKRIVLQSEVEEALGRDTFKFLKFAQDMHLLRKSSEANAFEFLHLKLRDYCAIPVLLDTLKNAPWMEQQNTLNKLGDIGDIHTAAEVAAALESPREFVRNSVCHALGKIGGPIAIEYLYKELADSAKMNRILAFDFLLKIDPANIFLLLKTALNNDHWVISIQAIRYIATLSYEDAFPFLQIYFQHTFWAVQVAVAQAMGDLDDIRLYDSLVTLCNSPILEVQVVAIAALIKISQSSLEHNLIDTIKTTIKILEEQRNGPITQNWIHWQSIFQIADAPTEDDEFMEIFNLLPRQYDYGEAWSLSRIYGGVGKSIKRISEYLASLN